MFALLKVRSGIRLLCMLFVGLIAISCNRIHEGRLIDGKPVIIQLDSGDTYTSLADMVEEPRIIPLDTSDNSPFSEPENQRVIYVEEKIVVFDVKFISIKIFDTSGKYLCSIGKLGMDKGAFVRAEDVQYNPLHHSKLVLCNKPAKICEFTLDGKLLKEWPLNFFASSFVVSSDNERVFFVNQNKSEISADKNILVTDSNYKVRSRLFDLPANISSTIRFSGGLYLINKDIYFMPAFSNTYYSIKGDTAEPAYKIDYGKKNLPAGIQEYILFANTAKYSFQYETFVKNDRYIGFNYLNKNLCMAFYQLNSGKTIIGDVLSDSLNILFRSYTYSYGNDQYASFINAKKVVPFIIRNANTVQKRFPTLYASLSKLNPDENPYLLIYSLKQ